MGDPHRRLALLVLLAVAGCREGAAARGDVSAAVTDAAIDIETDGYANADGPCTPGLPRCHGPFGYQVCEQDGTWGSSRSCAGYSDDGTSSYCATVTNRGEAPWATCVDPACWYWLSQGFVSEATAVGVCTPAGGFKRCNAGGVLQPATCAGGCVQVGTLDGRALGICSPPCEDGARECLGGGPLYRVCAGGRWQTAAQACAGGEACVALASGARPDIRCGGPCDPGTTRCVPNLTSIERCSADGAWIADRSCALGRCGQQGPQAQCQADCLTGQFQCALDGASMARGCDDGHRWSPPAPCPVETTCRVAGGVALGCVACVGTQAFGGNAFGVTDSRCDGNSVVRCQSEGRWGSAEPCGAGATCVATQQGPSSTAACSAMR